MTDTNRTKRMLLKKKKPTSPIKAKDLLSTGSKLLNLACTGRVEGGFVRGMYFWIVGDSDSGKTWLSLSCLAEAARNTEFDDYRFIHDDVAGGVIDIQKYFGVKVKKRIESPQKDKNGNPIYSDSIEDFYYNLDDALDDGRPFIYILDDMDCLTSKYEGKKFKANKLASRKGRKETGSMGDGKAKITSSNIRVAKNRLKKNGSILIIISQTRANMGPTAEYEPKTVSGGHALKYHAMLQIWSSLRFRLKKDIKLGKMDQKIEQGIMSKVEIKKNHLQGKSRTVMLPIYHSYGIDDVGSCVDYLISVGHWKGKNKGTINAEEFDVIGNKEKIIRHIEDNDYEDRLGKIVQRVWDEIEKATAISRKKRYV